MNDSLRCSNVCVLRAGRVGIEGGESPTPISPCLVTAGKKSSVLALSLGYSQFKHSACAKRSLILAYMNLIYRIHNSEAVRLCSEALRSRSFSPNPERFPSSGIEAQGSKRHSRTRPHHISPERRCMSAGSARLSSPELAGPGQDSSSWRGAREREKAPQHRASCRGRGVIAERSRRARGQARTAGRRPRGAWGKGMRRWAARRLERRQRRPQLLTQPGLQALPFRLRHIAAALAGVAPQTSREPAGDEAGRGLHGGLREASAANGGCARL